MDKKKWVKPELKVFVRGKNEESVLVACKTGKEVFTGPIGGSYCLWNLVSCKNEYSS